MELKTKTQKELNERVYDETGVDIKNDIEELPDDIDELLETLEERINEHEVIYYYNAINYLSEHDQSLCESLGLAHELGYTADNINSELLATLLQQQNEREALYELRDELEEAFYSDDNTAE